ncbi:hypothetical protein HHK36_008836 [Tetracentron sinense]|uniref:AT-hook motif nuclear-localized protein n=1 Tax=Tetracentron sinense TaxID=13715 RepID=A0A835DNQ6_TETSI|nr:hypothetical protein HHK36_008836 [Tetracentron sinense]
MRLAFSADGTAVYKPVITGPSYQTGAAGVGAGDGSAGAIVPVSPNMNMGEPVKRKRGRPRKYGPNGSIALGLTTAPPANQSGGISSSSAASASSAKKAKGRPQGSGQKHLMAALGGFSFLQIYLACDFFWAPGFAFTPHVISVMAGEDISSKIMSLSQHGPQTVCILSANGSISNVTLRQATTYGGTVTYEGRFEILSLSGSFILSESGGQRSRTGGLSVSLAGPDGRVLGGGVAGLLTAASPVQIVVGSFISGGGKESKSMNQVEPSSAPSKLGPGGGATGASSPTSRGTPSESSGGTGSPLNQNNPQVMTNVLWK